MVQNKRKIVFKQKSNVDFLFGYIDGMIVPTKQDGYKPIEIIRFDENGNRFIMQNTYQRKPDKASIETFKLFIKILSKNIFTENKKILMPNQVKVSISFLLTKKRFFDVDVDNLAKTVLDSLNGIAYDDDKQVSKLNIEKYIDPLNKNGILIAVTKIINVNNIFERKLKIP